MKKNRFMCMKHYGFNRRDEKKKQRQRPKEKMDSMINYPHCVPEKC